MKVLGTNITITDSVVNKMDILPLGDCVQDNLPVEYQAVEYIESTGIQYIDTGFKPNQDTSLEVDFTFISFEELRTQIPFGCRNYSQNPSFWFGDATGVNNNYFSVSYGTSYLSNIISISDINNVRKKYLLDKNKFFLDGTLLATATANNFQTSYNMYLFTMNSSGSYDTYLSKGKLYNCKIYDNDTLIRNFIPCYRISDNEIGLYDLVNNVFYTNQGTGTFTKGNDISIPNPNQPIDIKVVTGNNSVLVQNKNLLDTNDMTYLGRNGVNYQITEGKVTETIDTVYYQNNVKFKLSDEFTKMISGKTVTLSINVISSTQNLKPRFNMYLFNADDTIAWGDIDTYPNAVYGEKSITATIPTITEGQYFVLNLYACFGNTADHNIGDTCSFENIQLELGSTATTYVPYAEQSTTLTLGSLYLGGIGDNRDYINSDTKKKIGVIDYIVLDGSEDEDWHQISGTFRINKEDLGIELEADSVNIKCNQYIFQSETPTVIGQARVSESKLIFKFDDGTASVEDFKTWLSSNNLVLYYVLEQPFEQSITDTTLASELEVLSNMRSYDGTTNITVTSEDTNAQMEAEVTYTSESDMIDKLLDIFDRIKSKLYHIIRSL